MATQQALTTDILHSVLKTVPYLTKLPAHRLWFDYDQEADVLYVSNSRFGYEIDFCTHIGYAGGM